MIWYKFLSLVYLMFMFSICKTRSKPQTTGISVAKSYLSLHFVLPASMLNLHKHISFTRMFRNVTLRIFMVLNNNSNNAHFKLPCQISWNISMFQMYYCINVKNRNFTNNYSLKNTNLNSNVLTWVGTNVDTNTLKLSTDKSATWTSLQSLFSTCLYKSDKLLCVTNIILKRFDYQIWVSLLL